MWGVMHSHHSAWTQALADFDTARRVAEGMGDHFRVYVVNLYAGWASTRAGDPAAGRVLLEQALTVAEQIGTVFHVALGKAWLAACYLALGTAPDRQQAEQAMGEAIRLFKELKFRPELARSYVCYARLFQQWRQQDTAAYYLSEAIRMFQEIGMDWDLRQADQVRRTLS